MKEHGKETATWCKAEKETRRESGREGDILNATERSRVTWGKINEETDRKFERERERRIKGDKERSTDKSR